MQTEVHSSSETLRDGSQVTVRPIRKQDLELEREFIERLSPQSRRFRFLGTIAHPSEALLKQLTDIDASRDVALIALADDAGEEREVGVARFSLQADGSAECAVTVSDDWQHRGLGVLLMRRLIEAARERGVDTLYSIDACDNHAMDELADYLGFHSSLDPMDSRQTIHTLDLRPAEAGQHPPQL